MRRVIKLLEKEVKELRIDISETEEWNKDWYEDKIPAHHKRALTMDRKYLNQLIEAIKILNLNSPCRKAKRIHP